MKGRLLLIMLFFAFGLAAASADLGYEIQTFQADKDIDTGLSNCYFVELITRDIFAPFGLNDQLSLDRRKEVLSSLYRGLKANLQKRIIFKTGTGFPLTFTLKTLPTKGALSLLVISNFDTVTKALVDPDAPDEACFAKQYYIFADKLFTSDAYNDLKNEAKTIEYLKKNSNLALAAFYVYNSAKGTPQMAYDLLEGDLSKETKGTPNWMRLKLALLRISIETNNPELFQQLNTEVTEVLASWDEPLRSATIKQQQAIVDLATIIF